MLPLCNPANDGMLGFSMERGGVPDFIELLAGTWT